MITTYFLAGIFCGGKICGISTVFFNILVSFYSLFLAFVYRDSWKDAMFLGNVFASLQELGSSESPFSYFEVLYKVRS